MTNSMDAWFGGVPGMACWGMNAFIFDTFNRTNRCSYFSLPNAHPNKIRNLNPDGQELLRLVKKYTVAEVVSRENGGCVRQKGSFDGHNLQNGGHNLEHNHKLLYLCPRL